MRQPTSFLENLQQFIAIPLRILRFLFLCYAGLSILIFSLILYYGDDFFKEPSPQEIRADPVLRRSHRLDEAPVKPPTTDSLQLLQHYQP